MRAFFSTLWQLASTALGAALFLGLMWYIARIHSWQWRIAARSYAGRPGSRPIATKGPETIVMTGRGETKASPGGIGYRVHVGVRIAVHADGLALSLIPPFSIMCPQLFLPYEEMEVAPTWWALWPDPFAIRMKRAPELDIILAQDLAQWLRVHSEYGPFGRATS
ncbi:MAG: hypothetical protein M3Q19_00180 [Pseudomonadota bacterium]|nr:hypothetical protein [Pseudomonadota bacterium]